MFSSDDFADKLAQMFPGKSVQLDYSKSFVGLVRELDVDSEEDFLRLASVVLGALAMYAQWYAVADEKFLEMVGSALDRRDAVVEALVRARLGV